MRLGSESFETAAGVNISLRLSLLKKQRFLPHGTVSHALLKLHCLMMQVIKLLKQNFQKFLELITRCFLKEELALSWKRSWKSD